MEHETTQLPCVAKGNLEPVRRYVPTCKLTRHTNLQNSCATLESVSYFRPEENRIYLKFWRLLPLPLFLVGGKPEYPEKKPPTSGDSIHTRLVTHPSTDRARRCLTSVIWREPVCPSRRGTALEILYLVIPSVCNESFRWGMEPSTLHSYGYNRYIYIFFSSRASHKTPSICQNLSSCWKWGLDTFSYP